MQTETNIKRVFILGATNIADPLPDASLEKSVKALQIAYPMIRATSVFHEDGVLVKGEGGAQELHYKIVLPAPKVNG